jgi:hypothetical protein
MIDCGIIYVAVGNKHISECNNSIQSARIYMKDISITVFSDNPSLIYGANQTIVVSPYKNIFLNKIPPMHESPYENTLFVDTDTIFTDRIYDTFLLLDQFDMMFCHAPMRKTGYSISVPDSFVEINTGVIFYKNNITVKNFIQSWLDSYNLAIITYGSTLYYNDQTSFRECLFNHKELRYYILPSEFNLRIIFPFFIGGNSRVRIVHGREPHLSQFLEICKQPHKSINVYKYE